MTTRFSPDAILVQTNLSGAVAAIQDDPDTPDANWLTAPTHSSDTDLRVSFPTPATAPSVGAGLQEFRCQLRTTGPGANPTAIVSIYEGGVLRASSAPFSISSQAGQVVSFTWDATLLTTASGANVECRIQGTAAGVILLDPFDTVEVGAVEWNATLSTVLTTSAIESAGAQGKTSLTPIRTGQARAAAGAGGASVGTSIRTGQGRGTAGAGGVAGLTPIRTGRSSPSAGSSGVVSGASVARTGVVRASAGTGGVASGATVRRTAVARESSGASGMVSGTSVARTIVCAAATGASGQAVVGAVGRSGAAKGASGSSGAATATVAATRSPRGDAGAGGAMIPGATLRTALAAGESGATGAAAAGGIKTTQGYGSSGATGQEAGPRLSTIDLAGSAGAYGQGVLGRSLRIPDCHPIEARDSFNRPDSPALGFADTGEPWITGDVPGGPLADLLLGIQNLLCFLGLASGCTNGTAGVPRVHDQHAEATPMPLATGDATAFLLAGLNAAGAPVQMTVTNHAADEYALMIGFFDLVGSTGAALIITGQTEVRFVNTEGQTVVLAALPSLFGIPTLIRMDIDPATPAVIATVNGVPESIPISTTLWDQLRSGPSVFYGFTVSQTGSFIDDFQVGDDCSLHASSGAGGSAVVGSTRGVASVGGSGAGSTGAVPASHKTTQAASGSGAGSGVVAAPVLRGIIVRAAAGTVSRVAIAVRRVARAFGSSGASGAIFRRTHIRWRSGAPGHRWTSGEPDPRWQAGDPEKKWDSESDA